MNNEIIKRIFPKEARYVKDGRCPICGKEMKDAKFRDTISNSEFFISGICQEDQDKIFGRNPEQK